MLAASSSKNLAPDLGRGGHTTACLGIHSEEHGSCLEDGACGPTQSDAAPKAAALKKIVLAGIMASTLESTDRVLRLLCSDVQSVQCGKAVHQDSHRALDSVWAGSGSPPEKNCGEGHT